MADNRGTRRVSNEHWTQLKRSWAERRRSAEARRRSERDAAWSATRPSDEED